jgi:hypothetical protein
VRDWPVAAQVGLQTKPAAKTTGLPQAGAGFDIRYLLGHDTDSRIRRREPGFTESIEKGRSADANFVHQ